MLILHLLLFFVVNAVEADVQVFTGNNVFNNGRCTYVDGVIYEGGQKRDATPAEIAATQQWQAQMDQWGRDFSEYMNDKMSHLFDPGYNAGPQPQTPPFPCLCSPQYCNVNRGGNNINQQNQQ